MSTQFQQDLDTLHILPLSIIPFETKALKSARLIKNSRLETMVELFSDLQSGSGQMTVGDAVKELQDRAGASRKDISILRKLARLSSYDVYSLRVQLREQDVQVNDFAELKLSPDKSKELGGYMKDFTHPLLMEIYGSDDMEIKSFDDILKLFREPDVTKAREKLDQMAQRLDINIMEIPRFMEDYGDIFLSLAYFKQCLANISPIVNAFFHSLTEIRNNHQLQSDQTLMKTCDVLENTFIGLNAHIKRLFDEFDKSSQDFWTDVSAERFREVEALIESYHTTIGGVLCALSVKTIAWHRLFPRPSVGGPMKRSEFTMGEMRQGIDTIREILKKARDKKPKAHSRSKHAKYEPSGDAASNATEEKKIVKV